MGLGAVTGINLTPLKLLKDLNSHSDVEIVLKQPVAHREYSEPIMDDSAASLCNLLPQGCVAWKDQLAEGVEFAMADSAQENVFSDELWLYQKRLRGRRRRKRTARSSRLSRWPDTLDLDICLQLAGTIPNHCRKGHIRRDSCDAMQVLVKVGTDVLLLLTAAAGYGRFGCPL